MSSTRDPILLLEPSNLLEPLNLADRHGDPANPSARPEREGSSRFMRPARKDSISSAPTERGGSWRLKSAAIVAGAFACLAAGAALPQLPELVFGDGKPAQQTKSAQQTVAQTIADATKQPVRVERAPAKPEEAKPAEPKPNEPTTSGSNQSIALTANPGTRPPVTDQPAPAAQDPAAGAAPSCGARNKASDDKCLEGGVPAAATARPLVPEPAAATTRPSVPDRNSDSAAGASRMTGASPTKPRAAPQTIWELDAGAQQSVNRRTPQRETADQPATADSNGQNARSSDRNSSDRNSSDRSSWERDRRQDQDSNRASSRRRERSAGDNSPPARYGESRQEQDVNRSSSSRRDRQDDYARGDDRRVFGRAPREDDRVIGSGPRHEGSMPMFPSLFGGW